MKSLSVFLSALLIMLGLTGPLQAASNFSSSEVFVLSQEKDPFASENRVPLQLRYAESTWLGAVVPGLGHFLLDEPLRGGLFMGGFVLAFPAGGMLGIGISQLYPSRGFLSGLTEALIFAMLCAGGVYIWNFIDARQLNIEKNQVFGAQSSLYMGPQGTLTWQISAF